MNDANNKTASRNIAKDKTVEYSDNQSTAIAPQDYQPVKHGGTQYSDAYDHSKGTWDEQFLRRQALELLKDAHMTTFGKLPTIIDHIIKQKAWKGERNQFKSFGHWALDTGEEGLGVNNNRKLWLLGCAMDLRTKPDHKAAWTSVLERVDASVKLRIKEDPTLKVADFAGNSLKTKAEKCSHVSTEEDEITYLPSRAGENSVDRQLLEMKRKHPDTYRKVTQEGMSMTEARKEAGMSKPSNNPSNLSRAQWAVRHMTDEERDQFDSWYADYK